jgi:hypothetical protein
MASGKKKTTMAKLNRERKLRERRVEKQVKKDLRRRAAAADADRTAAESPTADEGPGASSAA